MILVLIFIYSLSCFTFSHLHSTLTLFFVPPPTFLPKISLRPLSFFIPLIFNPLPISFDPSVTFLIYYSFIWSYYGQYFLSCFIHVHSLLKRRNWRLTTGIAVCSGFYNPFPPRWSPDRLDSSRSRQLDDRVTIVALGIHFRKKWPRHSGIELMSLQTNGGSSSD